MSPQLTLFLSLSIVLLSSVIAEDDVVTCGSVIKLKHLKTGFRLHSHKVPYGSGSGQQSVTGYPEGNDANSLWLVKGPHGGSCKTGAPIKRGEVFRLQHVTTGLNLHSHLHASPLSRQQEVSCYGPDGVGDTGDNWKLDGTGSVWKRGEKVRFLHDDTGKFLHSHSAYKYQHPIPGQQEVTCNPTAEPNNEWATEEGLYILS
eukprot:TRINITY_DN7210_c0_g1_i1.p1 TRINITY_DN7210_c0_g1~~TRINITY_DN7210_c0_g1_i1.p1  ORF type:complete len:222 (-),score=65.46 TRINITY_DN7210_c0_g1_i1:147-752(-)